MWRCAAAGRWQRRILFDRLSLTVAAIICLTLISTVIVAKIIGCTLPILAKRVGFDPAVMASPFITTIVDAVSLMIYFRIATAMMPGLGG